MQPAVPISAIGSAEVEEVAIQDSAVMLIKIHPRIHERFSLLLIIKARPAVTRLNAGAEEIRQARLVMRQVLFERFDRRRPASPLVFGERDEHPAHAWCLFPGTVENI